MSSAIEPKKGQAESLEIIDATHLGDAALAYLDLGLQPVPLHQGLAPVEGFKFQSKIQSIGPEEVPGWFSQAKAIALRTGVRGNGLIDLDLDCPEAVQLATALLPDTECVFGRPGNPDSHHLYRVPAKVAISTQSLQDAAGSPLVEILGEGRLTTAPPSMKPSGELVSFSKAGKPREIDPGVLQIRARQLAVAALFRRHYPAPTSKARHYYCLAMAGALLSSWDQDDAERMMTAICKAAGDDELQDRLETIKTTTQRIANGQSYESWGKVAEWLGDDAKAARKIAGTAAGPTGPQAEILAAKILKYVRRGPEFEKTTFPKPVEIIDGMIREKSVNIIFADTGVGKTFFAEDMSLRIARGQTQFLAWPIVHSWPTIYFDAELDPWEQQDRTTKLCPSGLPSNWLQCNLIEIWEDEAGDINLTNPECRHVVEKVLLESKAKVAVFDNLFAFARGNEKNTAEGWEGVLHWARTLAGKGYTIIFVAHTSRSGDLFGSITQKYLCRTILQLKPVKGQKSCFTLCGNKTRGKPLNPDNLLIRIVDYGDKIKLEYEQSGDPNHDPYLIPVLKAIQDGCPTVTQLAGLFGHDKSWASKRVQDYKKKGLIADGKPGIQPLTEQALDLLADAEVMNAPIGDNFDEAVL